MIRTLSLTLAAILLIGCTNYQYQIDQPADLVQEIGKESFQTIERDPLIYQLRTYDNHLVMRIHNPADTPVILLGSESFVVDPDGQSHPLPTQTIAPGSFIKLIFPPMQTRIDRVGPSIQFGVGTTVGQAPATNQPIYLQIDDTAGYYWEWEGTSPIRIQLTFKQGDNTFQQDFVISRMKI